MFKLLQSKKYIKSPTLVFVSNNFLGIKQYNKIIKINSITKFIVKQITKISLCAPKT